MQVSFLQNRRRSLGWLAVCAAIVALCVAALAVEEVEIKDPEKALIRASREGDIKTIRKLIATSAKLVDYADAGKKTALHYAAENDHADVMEFLLTAGAEIDHRNIVNQTPLHAACILGKASAAKACIAGKANLEASTSDGQKVTIGGTPLDYAARGGYLSIVKALVEKGATIAPSGSRKVSALHWACTGQMNPDVAQANGSRSNGEVIDYLVSQGAKLDSVDAQLRTPAHWAAEYGAADVMKHLLRTYPTLDLEAVNANVLTPLELCIETTHVRTMPGERAALVKLLLDHGAKVRPQTVRIAEKLGDKDIIRLLSH